MPADRFYFEGVLTPNISVEGAEFHHLKVMRIAVGEEVEIVNGKGSLAKAKLIQLEKNRAHFELTDINTTPRPPFHRILGIPLLRANKLEWIIEKGTELGADAFYLYPADHSEKLQLSANQLERLNHIIVSGLKQSGRLFCPTLEIFASFKELFATEGTILYGDVDPAASSLLKTQLTSTVLFITGPERGFSDKEEALLKEKALGVSLNPYTLRAETAPIAAISILSMRA